MTEARSIDFYFDFSSPYGYFAATRIDALAARHGRSTAWHPILLGVVFQQNGQRPLVSIPLKNDYTARDLARFARLLNLPFRLPGRFPISGQAPSRAYYWLLERDPALARKAALQLITTYFTEDLDISNPAVTAQVVARLGLAESDVLAAINDDRIKQRVKSATEDAIAKGVFGSPYIVVDGEPFWGSDRLDQVEQWLESGGW